MALTLAHGPALCVWRANGEAQPRARAHHSPALPPRPNPNPPTAPDLGVGCSELVRPVRPKPSHNRTMRDGRQRSQGSLAGNGRQATPIFDNCDPRRCDAISQSTPRRGKHQLRPPQVPGRERHPMAGDCSSTLRLRSGPEARMERRSARARRDDSAEHAAMVNVSEGVMRRRQAQPAYSG
jgi:hypothetical protein